MKRKVLFVIKTISFIYDDRIRKESLSIQKCGENVKILALLDSNVKEQGYTKYKIPFSSISLTTRKYFSQKKGLFCKTIEMYLRFCVQILKEKPNVLWIHNMEMLVFIVICGFFKKIHVIQKLVWDQHELPPEGLLRFKLGKYFFKYVSSLCDNIIVANIERKKYLLSFLGKKSDQKFFTIENFPDKIIIHYPKKNLSKKVKGWLNNCKYILAQGGAAENRCFSELVNAVMQIECIKLIVIGPYLEEERLILEKMWGKKFRSRIYFTGYVSQLDILPFIDNAIASIILYKNINNNHWYCAPNRLYQAFCRKIPVIVGINPPMADLVHSTGCGIVLRTDGSDIDEIRKGIKHLLNNYENIKNKANNTKIDKKWESQHSKICKIISI